MTEGETVLFTTSNGVSYLFDDSGIRAKDKAKVMPWDIPLDDYTVPTSRAWSASLIESDAGRGPESSRLTQSSLFVILTVSPAEVRYKEWRKQSGALLWVMNPWSHEELRFL